MFAGGCDGFVAARLASSYQVGWEVLAVGERAAALVGPVTLGDARLNRRLERVVEDLLDHPQATIPEACGTWGATIAAYRLLGNAAVTPEAITAGVARATVARCPTQGVLLAVQDTTSVDYTGHRAKEGVGPLESPAQRGVFVHTTLAVTPEGTPVGLLDQQLWARDPATVGTRQQRHAVPIEGKESAKWLRAVRATTERVGSRCRVVTVADREADVYELFALTAELASDWVIRARHDRGLAAAAGGGVEAAVAAAPVLTTQTVEVAQAAHHPPRIATLEVRATQVWVAPPAEKGKRAKAAWRAAHPDVPAVGPARVGDLPLGVVLVSEPRPPTGASPVRWLLVTSLPVTTVAEVLTCVQYYRWRWLVERFHFVLKSGCQVEQLQLEQGDRLLRALAIYSVVAAWLLHSTYLARTTPEAPATVLLDETAWRVLWTVHEPHQPLPAQPPTVREALRLIAQLGGFLGRTGDGEPGVKTVWRGFRRLHDLVFAWRIFTTVATASPP